MEPTPRYPLTPAALGNGVNVRVGNTVQATLFEHISTAAGPEHNLATSVELEPYPLTGTWRVRWPLAFGAIIGEIDAATRTDYALTDVIHECGFIPTAQATFALDRFTGTYDVTVHLALPQFVVPRNNPADGAGVLPSGGISADEHILVDVTTGEYTEAEILRMSPGQWLVELSTHEDTVVVTCDGRVLGTLSEQDSAEVRVLLETLTSDPAPLLARAMLIDGAVTLDVARYSTAKTLRHLPSLPVTEIPAPNVFQVYEFGDGTMAVTVDSTAAVAPEDQPKPTGAARTVDTPTTVAPPEKPEELEEELSEVEKVRLRRAQRDHSDRGTNAGRHRATD